MYETPIFGDTSIPNKAIPAENIQKSKKKRLNVQDKRYYHPTKTNVLSLLTVEEVHTGGCKKSKLTNYQRLYLISFLQQHQGIDVTLEIRTIKKAKQIFGLYLQTISLL